MLVSFKIYNHRFRPQIETTIDQKTPHLLLFNRELQNFKTWFVLINVLAPELLG